MVIVLYYPNGTQKITVPDTWGQLEVEQRVAEEKAVCYTVEQSKK